MTDLYRGRITVHQPVLVIAGAFNDTLRSRAELTNLTVHMYVRWHFGSARRIGTPMDQPESLPMGVKTLFDTPGSPIPVDDMPQDGIQYDDGVVYHPGSTGDEILEHHTGSSSSGSGPGSGSGSSGSRSFSSVSSGWHRV